MTYQTLITVDPSLTCSGWALFSLDSKQLLAVGKIKSMPPSVPMAWRMDDLQRKITLLFENLKLKNFDILICEDATSMRDPRAAMLVERVRGLFESVARAMGLCVPGRLNPRTVHHEIMGLRGRQLPRNTVKDMAVKIANSLYSTSLKGLGFPSDEANLKANQDIVDALLLGSLALSKVNEARVANVALEEFFIPSSSRLRTGRAIAR